MIGRAPKLLLALIWVNDAHEGVMDYISALIRLRPSLPGDSTKKAWDGLLARAATTRRQAVVTVRRARATVRRAGDEPRRDQLVRCLTRIKGELHSASVIEADSLLSRLDTAVRLERIAERLKRLAFRLGDSRLTKQRAEELLRRWIKEDPSVRDWTTERVAKELGCSVGLVAGLPIWGEIMEKTGRRRSRSVSPRRTVSLSEQGEQARQLARLVAEQRRQHEPSPLDDDARDYVRHRE